MNRFAASPHWDNWMIVSYFFLGGIAAGAVFVASLLELAGRAEDRRATRIAHYLAFPLMLLCGPLLIIDLEYPARFWHLMLQSERFPRPMLKAWSPISIGSWGVLVFSLFSFFGFVSVLAEDRRFGLGRLSGLFERLGGGVLGVLFRVGAALSALFLAGYTGALLSASNQPIWSDTTAISGLFLASAVSTGIAALLLLLRLSCQSVAEESLERLETADAWMLGLEAVMLGVFFLTLGGAAAWLFRVWTGWALVFGVLGLGLGVPLLLRRHPTLLGTRTAVASALLVLFGGLVLRLAVVGSAPAVLAVASR